jgi:ABC-2 type transport system ATP-binding protein
VKEPAQLEAARQVVGRLAVGEVQVDEHTHSLAAPVAGGADVLMSTLRELDAAGIALLDVGLRRPTLDDVFLTLTGHVAEAEPGDENGDELRDEDGTAMERAAAEEGRR